MTARTKMAVTGPPKRRWQIPLLPRLLAVRLPKTIMPRGMTGGTMAEKGQRIGVYPGTFDPITNGHMEIIRRATLLVDRLVIAVSANAGKGPLFTVEERLALVSEEIADPKNGLPADRVAAVSFDNLLMEFA